MEIEVDCLGRDRLPFAVFHVTHQRNAAGIRRNGLLSRSTLVKTKARFEDIADATLKKVLGAPHSMHEVTESNLWRTTRIVPSDFVPFHFLKPLDRPEVNPTDVYRWRHDRLPLVACVVRRGFLEDHTHVVCIGHWRASYWDGPILLPTIVRFQEWLANPKKIGANLKSKCPYLEQFFSLDIPNILQGRVRTEFLGPTNRYRHLLNSCVFVADHVPPSELIIVDLESLPEIRDDSDFVFRV